MARRVSKTGTDWSRAKHPMRASFLDEPGRNEPVQGKRDDGLDLVEAITAATALATVADLAADDTSAPVREDAVALGEADLLPTQNEASGGEEPDEGLDEED